MTEKDAMTRSQSGHSARATVMAMTTHAFKTPGRTLRLLAATSLIGLAGAVVQTAHASPGGMGGHGEMGAMGGPGMGMHGPGHMGHKGHMGRMLSTRML